MVMTDEVIKCFNDAVAEVGIYNMVLVDRLRGALMRILMARQPSAEQLVGVSSINIERMLAECVPGGTSCDPQQVADAIRSFCNAWPGDAARLGEAVANSSICQQCGKSAGATVPPPGWPCDHLCTCQPAAAPQPVTQDDVRDAEAELNCAEEVLDGYAAGLDLEQTHFDCIGDYIKAVMEATKAAAPAGVVGEPVAPDVPDLLTIAVECGLIRLSKVMDSDTQDALEVLAKRLLTATPARQALTDEQIADIYFQVLARRPQVDPADEIVEHGRAVMRACAESWGVTLVGIGGKEGA